MQDKKRNKNIDTKKRQLLLEAIGSIVQAKRAEINKGILLFSYEYDLSSLDRIEKGVRDPQITTLWKIANALGMEFGEFIAQVEAKLPPGFKLTDD